MARTRTPLRERDAEEREHLAEWVACRLDAPLTAAGVLFVLVIVADGLTPSDSGLKAVWNIATWALWGLFVLEFVVRLVIAPSWRNYLRRNWWQLIFLAVPFLRFLRSFTRSARLARAISGSVRGARTAGRALTSRLVWLASVTVGVILAASQTLYEFGPDISYPEALHDTALATISGEPMAHGGAVSDVLEIVLAIYATVFFAALAGSLGAFFLEQRQPGQTQSRTSGASSPTSRV